MCVCTISTRFRLSTCIYIMYMYVVCTCKKWTNRGQNDKSDPGLFPVTWLPLGAPNVPTPQPTNEMVVGTCQANIIEEKINLFVLFYILHTIFHVYSLVGQTFQDTERPPINPPLHGGKWWWWKRLWTLPPISCGSLGWYKPMWTMYNLEWFEIGQPPSPLFG